MAKKEQEQTTDMIPVVAETKGSMSSMQLRLFVEGDAQVVKLVRRLGTQDEYAGSTQAEYAGCLSGTFQETKK